MSTATAPSPLLTPRALSTIDRVLAVLETGEDPKRDPVAAYKSIGDRRDGAGLTGGKHQATDQAGSLVAIVRAYLARESLPRFDEYRVALQRAIPWLESHGSIGDGEGTLHWRHLERRDRFVAAWRCAAEDTAMHAAQDEVFERVYLLPAIALGEELGLRTALGYLVLYDTSIQSGGNGVTTQATTADAVWTIRRAFTACPPSAIARPSRAEQRNAEATWLREYILARMGWLTKHPSAPVRASVYRVCALEALATAGNWALQLPLTVELPQGDVVLER